ncbi:hypothetical protein MP11Mi_10530 [Gordonia sp. MP11Mi]|uniref:Uncharacterized protein n=1 Tax=Gordonia sp. MP11Mi TaxID=3022769 RepID=A0AA97CTW9_9ACTN
MADSATIADWVSASSTLFGSLVTAVSVVVATVFGVRTLRQTKRDSIDRSRPMVAAHLERDPHPTGLGADLVVKNYGPSVAHSVAITFTPPIEDTGTRSGEASFVPLLLRRYRSPIPNLVPGMELRNLWNIANKDQTDEYGQYLNDEPIPDRVIAKITYRDSPSEDSRTNTYEDTFILDINVLRGEVITTHSDDHLGLHKRSTKALESIESRLK